jgi:hypothetical protein
MKFEIHYVVRRFSGGADSVGRGEADCEFAAGPFSEINDANEWKLRWLQPFEMGQFHVVSQMIEAN